MAQIVDVSQQARGGTAAIGYSYGVYHQQQAQTWQAFPPQQFYGGYGGQPQAQAYVQDPTQVAAAYQLSGYQGGFVQRGGRGGMRGGGYGYGGSYLQAGYAGGQMGAYGGRGGMMQPFGFRARRKKPFVGGSLETQRQWEQQTVCCFHLQGQCRFTGGCRFVHVDDGVSQCQFGGLCRVGHGAREGNDIQQQVGQQQPPVDGEELAAE